MTTQKAMDCTYRLGDHVVDSNRGLFAHRSARTYGDVHTQRERCFRSL